VVWTNEDYLDLGLSSDYLRYYLLSYTSHTKELNFSWKEYQARVNNELVDTIGNFFYRTLHFSSKKLGGIPRLSPESEIIAEIEKTIADVDKYVKEYEFKSAIEAVMALGNYGNTYIQTNAPWKLIKENEGEAKQVIRNCLQIVKALTILLDSVIPDTAQKSWELMGFSDKLKDHNFEDAVTGFESDSLPSPEIIFRKIEDEEVEKYEKTLRKRVEEAKLKENKQIMDDNLITIDEFAKMELKTGTIIEAEPIEGSKKLLKIQVDLGDEKRQIVSGIAKYYKPKELAGLDVIIVANLKPAKLFGVESNGMILAAGEEAALLTTKTKVLPGTKVM
ncbi:MAG: methionine--tRNA ligase subunit beta, partial [Methanomicrobium sp.]|nr:methionine--tRNA ligase subunit beta [Methanomicrobium sp.]